MKGIRADIYRGPYGDCSNGGISGRVKTVTVVGPGIEGPFEPTEDAPAVRLVFREIGGQRIVHAVPVDTPTDAERRVGPMDGGCYIASSDSRFRRAVGIYGAVALHDRWETPEQYRSLSI